MPKPPPNRATVSALVEDAAAAPSMHNAQPWRFRYDTATGTLRLTVDTDRVMPAADPDLRAVHLGCGAALFNLRVAAAHAGWFPRVRLVPDPAEPTLLATVDFAETGPVDKGLEELSPAIRRRHTSRWPFAAKDIPGSARSAVGDAADREGARLRFAGQWHANLLRDLVRDAEGRDGSDPERQGDVERWTRRGDEADVSHDGVPEYAFGPRARSGGAPMRDFAGRHPVRGPGTAAFEDEPNLALLGTAGDGPAEWLRAGQAMERVLLVATVHGLAASVTSHALEWPDLRDLARDPLSDLGQVQMVLRLGYGPMGPVTPRRPLGDILSIV
ncbi:Acg family FMN-binding oxidoreductase [Streptomyces sp. NPDC059897]|uniref:Acg family FMN-binding oxidoreductase n=1 Tax=Streptomyces sp. NPDC059897 TaxID=3346994 RepID=UPI00365658DD